MKTRTETRDNIKNWRPLSLLNVDIKILSKALSKNKEILPCLISTKQTAHVQNTNISESRRLISDVIEFTNIQQMEGFLVTMDVEKAFDSLDHKFLISVLKKNCIWSKLYLVDRNNFKKSRIVSLAAE